MIRVLIRLLLLAITIPALAQPSDLLRTARERIEMRSWGDALTYIQQELAARPLSWRGHMMLGEYYLSGASQPGEARTAYAKAYRIASRMELNSDELQEFRSLHGTLMQLMGEALAAGGQDRQGTLEDIVFNYRFMDLSFVTQLLQKYADRANWNAVYRTLALLHGVPEANRVTSEPSLKGKLLYLEGQAAEGLGDTFRALQKFDKAKTAGMPLAEAAAKRVQAQLEQVAGSLQAEGKRFYEAGDYKAAREKFVAAFLAVPRYLSARVTAQQGIDNCDRAAVVDDTCNKAEALRQKGRLPEALALLEDSVARVPEDPRTGSRRATREKARASIRKQIDKDKALQATAVKARRTAGDRCIGEAQELASRGDYGKAAQALDRAEKLGSGSNIPKLREALKAAQLSYERFMKAVKQFRAGQVDEAVKALEACYDEDEGHDNPDIAKYLALAYFKQGQAEKAIKMADRYLAEYNDKELLERATAYHEGRNTSLDSKRKAKRYLSQLKTLTPADASLDQRMERLDHLSFKIEQVGKGLLIAGALGVLALGFLMRGTGTQTTTEGPRTPTGSHRPLAASSPPPEMAHSDPGIPGASPAVRREAIRKTLRNQVHKTTQPMARPSRTVPRMPDPPPVDTGDGFGTVLMLWAMVWFRTGVFGGVCGVFLAGAGQPPALGSLLGLIPIILGCFRYRGGGPAECARIILELCDNVILLRWPVILGICICASSTILPALMHEQYGDGGVWAMVLVGAAGLFVAWRGVMD
jgi:tetratricopeptide (TPR) repeat protein